MRGTINRGIYDIAVLFDPATAALVYDPVTNPTGTRSGDPDLATAVWGTTAGIPAGSSRALKTGDNVGIQYGLKALLAASRGLGRSVTD